jgi:protein LSM14
VKPANEATAAAPVATAQKAPTPPNEAKPNVAIAAAPPAPTTVSAAAASKSTPISAPTGPKSGRIMPVVPLPNPAPKVATGTSTSNGPVQSGSNSAPQQSGSQPSQAVANAALQNATQAATAAVAAAMAKLPPAPGQKAQQGNDAVDNLTKKVNDMRANDNARTSRQPGTTGHAGSHKGGRGSFRGGNHQQNRKVDVPAADFDFETANAKFNKQDLVKEAVASGSPVNGSTDLPPTNGSSSTSPDGAKDAEKVVIPVATYNKSTSFFDNISSDTKGRDDPSGKRPGGREWRGEEQKKNLETFGQGSVDNGYRGGFRGRGRGRGWGGRGRGGYTPRGGRGSYRGGRNSQAEQNGTVGASA